MTARQTPVEAQFTLLRQKLVGRRPRVAARQRFPLATSGKLFFPDSGRSVYAWVANLSVEGVGLTLPLPLEVGMELVLHLRSDGGQLIHCWPARVVHVTRESDDCWRVGCTFVDKLSAQALQSLLG
jgi:hypothetical protein